MSDTPNPQQGTQTVKLQEVIIRQGNSTQYRTIHIDGAILSLTNHGDIFMALYSEHHNLEGTLRLTSGEKGIVVKTANLA